MYEIAGNVFVVIKNVDEEDNARRGRCACGTYRYKPAEGKYENVLLFITCTWVPQKDIFIVYLFLSQL